MPLSPGDKLGPYEILSALGAGGMGEVFKAKDKRLQRTVAIKVLPDHIAQREDARLRFEREARAVASLQHPHICVLHDIGPGWMVMELIEGETLSARIAEGAVPLAQALIWAGQLADALDRAHRAGVTHRDVKPGNIMVTRDGLKVLDFGLAKSVGRPSPTEATLTKELTAEGTVVGTPQYMAPELFEGRQADARADIWAFGAVLYEMLTGRKAFSGKNHNALVGAILETDPAPMALQPLTPRWLERLVRRCLEKDPEERYQSMRDVVLELRKPPEEFVAAPATKAGLWPWVAGAFALVSLVSGALLYNASRPPALRPLMHLNVDIPPGTPLARVNAGGGLGWNMFALSPDGARLALSLRGADGKVRLHTRLLQQSQVIPLSGTDNGYSPFFSPAGDWIGFFAEGKMKKIAVEGGAAVTLCEAPAGYGGSWGDDGNIVAALNFRGGLSRVPSAGGTPVPVTKLNGGEVTHRWPQVLPGSQAVLFTAAAQTNVNYDDPNIEVVLVQTGERKTLHAGGFFPRYLTDATGSTGTGHLVYLHQSTLFAVPFDAGRLAVAGTPAPILEEVSSTVLAGGDFAFARNGTFVYLAGKAALDVYPISWVDRGGKSAQPLQAAPGGYFTPRFSPDGKRLAFAMDSGKGRDIWVKDLDRESASRLSFLPGLNVSPVWTPDGRNIVFLSGNPEAPGLYAIRADGAGEAKRLTEGVQYPASFSPDGKRLAIHHPGNGGSTDLFTLPVEADSGPGGAGLRLGKAELFLGTPFNELVPAFSPDGRWLAYQSNDSGANEVYVRPFLMPGGVPDRGAGGGTGGLPAGAGGGRWQVSTGGGRLPVWSRDGRELLFLTFDNRVMAVGYTAKGDTFLAGKPRVWAEVRLRFIGASGNFDLAPDGKRLVAMVADDAEPAKLPTSLTLLLNFGDELRRRAPGAK